MTTTNIKSRQSIHRHTPESTPSVAVNVAVSKSTTHHESQEELSDGNESSHANTTQSSEESFLAGEPSQRKTTLELRNRSEVKNYSRRSLNGSGKNVVRTPSLQRKSFIQEKQSNSMRHESSYGKTFILMLLVIIIPVALTIFAFSSKSSEKRICSFSGLQKKYPKEGDYLWHHLKYGNENILNNESEKPAVFLFVHHGNKIAEKLINEIAETSAHCYGSSTTIHKNIGLTSKEAIKDYGHVIDRYKNSIQEENVILIANLNEIPGEAAKALHSICDTVTPLVKKVVILLSLTVEQKNSEEKVIDSAENALKQLWKDKIKPNELDPIITRVTDQVLLLQSN